MWRESGGCGGRVVNVEGGWWMWRESGGCGGRVDVKGGWMWRKGGCGGRMVTHAKNNVQPLTTKRIGSGHLC